jgi:two-component system, LytTR family, response regulator
MVPALKKPSVPPESKTDSCQEDLDSLRIKIETLSRRFDEVQGNAEGPFGPPAQLRPHPVLQRMLVKSEGKLILLHTRDIDWIEAWGDYVRLHCKGKTHISRQKISEIEQRLDQQQYFRINRSAIINIDRMKELEPLNHGDYLLTLQDDTQLNVSRNYRFRLSALFNNLI